MDGNGRWAAARGLPRVEGHRRGVEALRKTVRAARDLGISVLTIFSFSSENWSRPPSEIRDLLRLCGDRSRSSADVKHLTEDHIAALDAKIALLSEMRATLSQLAEACDVDDRPDCPIIDSLAGPLRHV